MPSLKRYKTKYPEVFYIRGKSKATGKPERIYYIRYRRGGKRIEEKAGRQFQDDMTPARASRIRSEKIDGKQLSNKEKRQAERVHKEAEVKKWTIDRLWKEYKNQRIDSKSLRVDDNRYQNYIKTKFGDKEPKELIQLEIDRVRINLLKKREPQTVKHILTLLKRIVNFGVKKGLSEGLNFSIEMPKVHNLRTEDLTPDQLSKLLKAIDQEENIQVANFMKIALFTGMRRGELFKLKWKHIDLERGFIQIIDPKGGPDQKIPLNDAVKELIQSHPRSKSQFVFPGRGGRQRTDINHQVNKIKKEAGLPKDFRPLHGLRHVYASMLASSGKVDMYTLQKLLTHKSPLMTQRYAHLRDDALRRASRLAGDIIKQAASGPDKDKVVNLEDHKT
jgi:integrase